MAHRVLIYTLDGRVEAERAWLAARGLTNEFQLTGIAHEAYDPPTFEQLRGYEAVVGEMMPVRGASVDAFARADVRLVASMSIGLNHMDVAGLAERGVLVSNCPGYCADDVALHAVALMLDLMRQVTFSNRAVVGGAWRPRGGYEMRRTQSLTCGLVFFGNIARKVAPIVQALGMRVVVWAPTRSAQELAAAGCEKAETLDELLSQSDVVSLHCPLIPETQGLIGARELALMKPSAFLINTSRGPVIDEDALADALDAGTIRAAALDVLADETAPNQRLVQHPRCVVTPHEAYVSREADAALVDMCMQSVVELLVEGRTPTYLARA